MKKFGSVLAFALLATLAAPATFAETSATPELSPRAVTLTLTMPGVRPVKLTIKEGTMARLTRASDNTAIAIAPTILDENEGVVTAQVFQVSVDANGGEALTPLGSIDVRRDQPIDPGNRGPGREIGVQSAAGALPLFGIRLELQTITTTAAAIGGSPRCAAAARPDFSVQPHGPCSRCCVTCDGWTFCGCAVEASCGSCCCTVCC